MIRRNTKVNEGLSGKISSTYTVMCKTTEEQSDSVKHKQHCKCCATSECTTLRQSDENVYIIASILIIKT